MVYYAEVFTFDEMIQIVFSPAMITYILVATTLGLLFFKTKLSVIDIAKTLLLWIAQLFGLPLVLLFVIPAFILFITTLESWSKDLPLSKEYPFISFSKKIVYVIVNTLIGNIFLIVLFYATLHITQADLSLNDLIFKCST